LSQHGPTNLRAGRAGHSFPLQMSESCPAQEFRKAWAKALGCECERALSRKIGHGGTKLDGPRQVRKDEVGDLVDVLSDIFPFREWYSRDHMVSRMSRARSRRETLVIAEDGRPVSHIRTVYNNVSIYGRRMKVASIGSVGTHLDCRGRGYAGAILKQTMQQMVKRGAKVLIVSGSRGLYRRVHCAPAGRMYEAEVRSAHLGGQTSDLTVRQVTPEEWPALAPLHQAENVRFARNVSFFSDLVFWWDCQYPQIWVVESRGEPLAYVSLVLVWGKESETQRRAVAEYAGSRAALMDALPALFAGAGRAGRARGDGRVETDTLSDLPRALPNARLQLHLGARGPTLDSALPQPLG